MMFHFQKEKFPEDSVGLETGMENTIMEDGSEQEGRKRRCFGLRRGMAALALCAMFFLISQAVPVLASDSSSSIDFTLASKLVDLVKAVNVLFTVEPINYFVIGSLLLLAFRLFKGAKKVATN